MQLEVDVDGTRLQHSFRRNVPSPCDWPRPSSSSPPVTIGFSSNQVAAVGAELSGGDVFPRRADMPRSAQSAATTDPPPGTGPEHLWPSPEIFLPPQFFFPLRPPAAASLAGQQNARNRNGSCVRESGIHLHLTRGTMASTAVPSAELAPAPAPPTEEMAALKTPSQDDAAGELPPHRSHDPAKNLKRSDPFQFGSRFLSKEDDVFEFNAWDHVETDDAYKEYTERQLEMQRQAPVSDFDKSKPAIVPCSLPRHPKDVVMIHFQCIVHLKEMMKTYLHLVFRSHLNTSCLILCHILHFSKHTVADSAPKTGLTRTPQSGGTFSTRTMRPTFSRTASGCSRSSRSLPT